MSEDDKYYELKIIIIIDKFRKRILISWIILEKLKIIIIQDKLLIILIYGI